jgi:hypothetical protein
LGFRDTTRGLPGEIAAAAAAAESAGFLWGFGGSVRKQLVARDLLFFF